MSDKNLRSALIRLAHANPSMRPALLPLLKKQAADLDDDVIEVLDYILKSKRLPSTRDDGAVSKAWQKGNNSGDGYDPGDEEIDELEDIGKFLGIVDDIAVYWDSDKLVLVGDAHGAWAVDYESE